MESRAGDIVTVSMIVVVESKFEIKTTGCTQL